MYMSRRLDILRSRDYVDERQSIATNYYNRSLIAGIDKVLESSIVPCRLPKMSAIGERFVLGD